MVQTIIQLPPTTVKIVGPWIDLFDTGPLRGSAGRRARASMPLLFRFFILERFWHPIVLDFVCGS